MALSYALEETVNFNFNQEEDFSSDYKRILSLTKTSVRSFANCYYKTTAYLDSSDIEQIKNALNNYKNNNEKITEFKQAIIEDLTNFQNEIKENYVQRLAELGKEKQLCEKQMKVLEFAKNKLIMDRLAKIEWPYDSKTKEYDAQIAKLELRIKNLEQKIEDAQKMRPVANEKDILIYQMHLQETFVK